VCVYVYQYFSWKFVSAFFVLKCSKTDEFCSADMICIDMDLSCETSLARRKATLEACPACKRN